MRRILLSALILCAFLPLSAKKPSIKSIDKWADASKINWTIYDRMAGATHGDWQTHHPELVNMVDNNKINAGLINFLWQRTMAAKSVFHQENLWILTMSKDSATLAMVDVELAFDKLFIEYILPMPGNSGRGLKTGGSASRLDDQKLNALYNKNVGEKIAVLRNVKGLRYYPNAESTLLAESVKKWYTYGTADWSEVEVGECPEKYLKKPVRGHHRADIKTEWTRVQSTLAHFRESTKWLRDKEDSEINQLLDDCEKEFMNYFEKYRKGVYTEDASASYYSEVIPMAIDILCVDYSSLMRKRSK